jgi:ketosteroid isomerase-like protein
LVYLLPEKRELIGKSAFTAFLRETYERPEPVPKRRTTASEVKVVGYWAFEWGHVESVRPGSDGAKHWGDGRYMHVYQRQTDGRWQIARACYNGYLPKRDLAAKTLVLRVDDL